MARPQEFNSVDALNSAMGVFWKKGYEATSMIDLLSATGLSKSSLYGTFGGKRELFLAAFDAYRRARARDMARILSQGTAREAIEGFFRTLFADVNADEPARGCMSINQGVEMAPHDLEVQSRVVEDFRQIEDGLCQAVKRGQKDGSISNKQPAQKIAKLLVLCFPGLQVMARIGYLATDLDKVLEILLSNLD